MLVPVHVEMLRAALDGLFSRRALNAIVRANAGADAIWNQFGRHELHFDDNAFDKAYAYLDEQRGLIRTALEAGAPRAAWSAFGRLTHTAQDFYSHSNYVELWIARHSPGVLPRASEIDPLDENVIGSPALRSGKAYLPLGLVSFFPVIGGWVDQLLPQDSHAHMHLDSKSRGPLFEYAWHAAVKRTRQECDWIFGKIPEHLVARFRDLPS